MQQLLLVLGRALAPWRLIEKVLWSPKRARQFEHGPTTCSREQKDFTVEWAHGMYLRWGKTSSQSKQ